MTPIAVGIPLIQCNIGHTSLKYSICLPRQNDRTSNTHFLSFLVLLCFKFLAAITLIDFLKTTNQTLRLSRSHKSKNFFRA